MPKIAIDYATRKVSFYKFVCNNSEIQSSYVGSTVNFTSRKSEHKSICNNPNNKNHNCLIYQIIRENGGWDNWRMIEIESRLVKDKREGEKIEQEWIEKLQTVMNTNKSYVGENIKEYRKQYHIENGDVIREQRKQFRIENADAIREQKKQFYIKNADAIKEKSRLYKLKKKEQSTCNPQDSDTL